MTRNRSLASPNSADLRLRLPHVRSDRIRDARISGERLIQLLCNREAVVPVERRAADFDKALHILVILRTSCQDLHQYQILRGCNA